jgi:hypothetical protein
MFLGQWVAIQWKHPIRPSVCTPAAAWWRRDYVCRTHDATPTSINYRDGLHLDFGGMVSLNDPITEVVLGPHRKVTVYRHQLAGMIDTLKLADRQDGPRGLILRRFALWPGQLVFLSERDCSRLLAAWSKIADPEEEIAHRNKMRRVLERAQNLPSGALEPPRPEAKA